jgi:hypothetical protein
MKSCSNNGFENEVDLERVELVAEPEIEDRGNDSTVSSGTREILFCSKCDNRDIPEVAQGVQWKDSFYENDSDIIAVFDIDRTIYDQSKAPRGILCILSMCFHFLCPIDVSRRSNKLRIKRRHIAIARRGIVFDDVDVPGSRNVIRRTIIKYETIKSCESVVTYSGWNDGVSSQIYLYLKPDNRARFIDGVIKVQQFIDIVNAMIDRSNDTTIAAAALAATQTQTTEPSLGETSSDVFAIAELL